MMDSTDASSNLHLGSTGNGQYQGDLWDKFPELITKMTIGKQNVKDLQAMVKAQADAFESMGKPFTKTKLLVDDKNLYTVNFSARSLLDYSHNMGQKQMSISQEMSKKLYGELTELRKELSKSIKNAVKDEKKLRSDLASARSAVASAKKKDHDEAKNYESLREKVKESDSLPPKKAQQLQTQMTKAEKSSQQAYQAYETAHRALVKMDETFYQKLGELMHSLEVLDRKRLHSTKSILMRYYTLQLEFSQLINNECETMRKAFEQIHADSEIQSFVSGTKSGALPLPVESFEPYIIAGSNVGGAGSDYTFSGSGGGGGSGSRVNTPTNSRPVSVSSVASSNTPTTTTSHLSQSYAAPINSSGTPPPTNFMGGGGGAPPPMFANGGATPPSVQSSGGGGGGGASGLGTVKALYDYDPTDEGELAFKEDDILTVLEKNPDGWWFGERNGVQGLFPSNFVVELSSSSSPPPSSSIPAPSLSNDANSVSYQAAPPSLAGGETTTALYNYEAQDPQELSFQEGDVIEILEKHDDGWWSGRLATGAVGLFPSNFTSGGSE